VRLDIEIKDRFGQPVIPREWYLVPLFVIKLSNGSKTARLRLCVRSQGGSTTAHQQSRRPAIRLSRVGWRNQREWSMRALPGTVHINKIAAASRQLDAAVRMFFTKEDELAIHTVASAGSGY
jgi:hypothetical protein